MGAIPNPGAGTGTSGSGILTSSLSGASYNTSYISTNLGQIWQGPQNGQGAAVRYLSCASALSSAGYDGWGTQTSRRYNGVTAMLSSDTLNRLVNWQSASGGTNRPSTTPARNACSLASAAWKRCRRRAARPRRRRMTRCRAMRRGWTRMPLWGATRRRGPTRRDKDTSMATAIRPL
ncbi:MAG TPA: hypothetical protein VKX46_00165 [Ktedonobacteraceae bacterium]|nr:hypothetical protein [Ktedonobacteraceae bacterium]